MKQGYIKLYRDSEDNFLYFYEPFTRWHAWQDLLLLANYKPGFFISRGVGVQLEAGQLGYAQKTLARRWKWSSGKVDRFLRLLADENQIRYQKNNVTTIITIVNWAKYQLEDSEISSKPDTKREPNGNQTGTNKNDNNDKKKSIRPTIEEVVAYFKEHGYTQTAAYKAFNYYEANDWKDGQDRPVKNWKQKMLSVWFKDEHKIAPAAAKMIYTGPKKDFIDHSKNHPTLKHE